LIALHANWIQQSWNRNFISASCAVTVKELALFCQTSP
jgi:hypothetical protein